jgi:hypothetical protein
MPAPIVDKQKRIAESQMSNDGLHQQKNPRAHQPGGTTLGTDGQMARGYVY